MVSIRAKLTVSRKGDLSKRLKQLEKDLKGPLGVKVGFPAGAAPGDLISIAYWNHEGTNRAKGDVFFANGQFGISGPIPPRPFITQAMWKGRGEIKALMKSQAIKIFNGNATLSASLPVLGLKGQDVIQKTISSGSFKPNSAMTVYLKGSSKPLIDTSRMLGGVTWKIDK